MHVHYRGPVGHTGRAGHCKVVLWIISARVGADLERRGCVGIATVAHDHIAGQDPVRMLRRIEQERKLFDMHAPKELDEYQ